MKPKEIIKRAASVGDVDQTALMQAVTKQAVKAHPDAPTEAIAFSRYVAVNPDVMGLLKAAPAAPAKAQQNSSFGILAAQALAECQKRGLPLPANSPYRSYLMAKAGDVEGERDAVDSNFGDQASKAVRSVAAGLVKNGQFSDISTAIRFMRSSPAYANLFSASPRYSEAIRSMLRDHLP